MGCLARFSYINMLCYSLIKKDIIVINIFFLCSTNCKTT